jgi:hypothetical protein
LAFAAGLAAGLLLAEAYRWRIEKKEPVLHPWGNATMTVTPPPPTVVYVSPELHPYGTGTGDPMPETSKVWCDSSQMFDTFADCGER